MGKKKKEKKADNRIVKDTISRVRHLNKYNLQKILYYVQYYKNISMYNKCTYCKKHYGIICGHKDLV